MRKRTREILALVLLGVLLLVGVGAMGYYILVGHNWNVTASNIDDSIGQMDGYTVFLYEGTHPNPAEAERISDAQPMLDDQSRGNATHGGEPDGKSAVGIDDVARSYRDKGAVVFTLDVRDLPRYSEPIIVGKAGKRVAFMSVTKGLRKAAVRRIAHALYRKDAHGIVALTNSARAMKTLEGEIPIIICDDPRNGAVGGEWRGSSYCVGVPYIGEVEAVVQSPYGVLSSKTITEI